MDFLSNGFHQLYSELELDDDFFFSSSIGLSMKFDYDTRITTSNVETPELSSSPSSSLLSSVASSTSSGFDFTTNFIESEESPSQSSLEIENILTNDYGKTFQQDLDDDYYSHDHYHHHHNNNNNHISSDNQKDQQQCCTIDSWENSLLENFIELPELFLTSDDILLPERTPLCNDSCNSFLKESSDNLNKFRRSSITPVNDSENTNSILMDCSEFIKSKLTTESINEGQLNYCDDMNDENITIAPTSPAAAVTTTPQPPLPPPTITITFPCNFGNCTKVYAKPAHLKAHLRRHLGDKPYICTWPNCTWRFSRSDELARHKRSHSGIKPYECCYCSKCFARSDHLSKHRKVHERKMQANKLKGIFVATPSTTIVRPGRRPKNSV